LKRIDCLLRSPVATAPMAPALQGCDVQRPVAFDAGVEVVSAGALPRAFPTRVSEGLGVCVKWGPPHDVIAMGGPSSTRPTRSVCARRAACGRAMLPG
jgi:hypothetical protein